MRVGGMVCWHGNDLAAHALIVRCLSSLSAGAREQKSEARPTAPSRGRLVIGFACTRPTDFAGGGTAGRRRVVGLLRCSDYHHGSHSTFYLHMYRIFLLSFDARCHVLLIGGGMLALSCSADEWLAIKLLSNTSNSLPGHYWNEWISTD